MRSLTLGLALVAAIFTAGSLVVACSTVETAPGHASQNLDAGQDAGDDGDAGDGSFWFPRCQYCDLVYGCVDSGPDVYTETCDGGQMCGRNEGQPLHSCCTPVDPFYDMLCHH